MKIHPYGREEDASQRDSGVANSSEPLQSFHRLFKPIIVSLMICGLYFEEDKPHRVYCKKIFNFRNYSIFMLLVGWFECLRYIVDLAAMTISNNTTEVLLITSAVWRALCAFNATFLFYGCRTHIPHFRKSWNDLLSSQTFVPFRTSRDRQKTRVCVIRWVATGWLYFIANLIGFAILIISTATNGGDDRSDSKLIPPSTITTVFKVILSFNSLSAWILPLVFQITIFVAVSGEFEIVSEVLRNQLEENKTEFPKSLECIRRHHSRICYLVNCLDNVISLCTMNAYIFNIPLACFLLYSLISDKFVTAEFSLKLIWLLSTVIYVSVVSLGASLIPNKAHLPLEHVYDIHVNEATAAEMTQLKLFVARLNGPSVGFTVLKMVTITKEVMLTLAGLYLTYFFLVLQFKI